MASSKSVRMTNHCQQCYHSSTHFFLHQKYDIVADFCVVCLIFYYDFKVSNPGNLLCFMAILQVYYSKTSSSIKFRHWFSNTGVS